MVCAIDRLVVVRALSGFGFLVAKLGLGRFASGGVVVCSKRSKYLDLIGLIITQILSSVIDLTDLIGTFSLLYFLSYK